MNYSARILLLLALCGQLALPLRAAETPAKTTPSTEAAKATNAAPLAPGQNDWRIALMTSRMLEEYHYLHLKFDPELSGRFFDMYINTLDPQHIHFLQSDLAEFERYRTNLSRL